jgi:hypothetical protein
MNLLKLSTSNMNNFLLPGVVGLMGAT